MIASRVLDYLSRHTEDMVDLLDRLVSAESPSTEPQAHGAVRAACEDALEASGLRVRRTHGKATAGELLGVPSDRRVGRPYQVVIGHMDTVWPVGTTSIRPGERRDRHYFGPGSYDMKAGIVQAVYALRALRDLEVRVPVDPVILLNSDEEIGSRESTRLIRRLASGADRALVVEPSLGADGRLKTRRKGVARFTVTVRGRAAHAGLDPGRGASAILELSSVVQRLFDFNDPERGISVNVGTIEGGLRANVVAPESRAVVDVRVWTQKDAAEVEAAIRSLAPVGPDISIEVEGRFGRPPMEPTPAARSLWDRASAAADDLGITLAEAGAGGASDGNTAAGLTPTLDGLGPVGGGAHAEDEHVDIAAMPERAALLALVIAGEPLGVKP